MITATAPAKQMLMGATHPPDQVLRLEPVEAEKLGFVFGDDRPGDQVIEHDGEDVLHIPAELSEQLDGYVIDGVPTSAGEMALTLSRPDGGEHAAHANGA